MLRKRRRGEAFGEDHPLGGDDPYSASKAGQELVAAAFRASFFPPETLDRHGIAVATARAGNVIGGGDWTTDGLVADVVRALADDRRIPLRYPNAVRPWQHVLEPLSGYLTLGARLLDADATAAEAWNFGPDRRDDARVRDIVDRFLGAWGSGRWEDASGEDHPAEAAVLRLNADKAAARLGWRPRWRLSEAVDRTVAWYRRVADDPADARAACTADLADYAANGVVRGV